MPPGNKNIRHEDGVAFSTENQPANRGRKPRVFSQLAKDFQSRGIERATPAAVAEAYEYLLALTWTEVKEIAGKPDDEKNDYPALLRAAAKELRGKQTIVILRDMLNRAHGLPKQAVEHSTAKDAPIQFENVSLEDRLAFLALADKMTGNDEQPA
jgi:flavin-binding protein dodecin